MTRYVYAFDEPASGGRDLLGGKGVGLAEIRRARVRAMGAPSRNRQYAELAEIYEELEQAEKLHRRLGCPVIDISELSIEETAHRILRLVEERAGEARAQATR
ncbi:MAG TPA: kinase/pyrophosphorylase [Gaiellaceae bacterium]|nr:kinase/pyrophosphorylase [Gaiellaceae bacterium]